MNKLKALLAVCFLAAVIPTFGQNIGFERSRYKSILDAIKLDVDKNYYDPSFKNIDIEAKYKEALQNLQNAKSIGQLGSAVAQFLVEFDDSHLFFIPPPKVDILDWGFGFRMMGDKCRVIYVSKGSDAETKGLRAGDEIRSISSFGPTRDTTWKIRYFFYLLFPQPTLTLAVTKPDGGSAEYVINPKIITGTKVASPDINQLIRDSEKAYKEETKQYFYDKFDGAFIWKMPAFSLDRYKVDDIIAKARKFPAIIFDLRGNPGGSVDMLTRLVSNVFDKDVKIGDEKRRKEIKELIARTRGKEAFSGKIVVLIDSDSASAAEVFAKVIQLENRGTIIGDHSAGAVMTARRFDHQWGTEVVTFYAVSVTIADLLMKDGKSLEKVGVTPDILLIPTQQDLAAKRDVVMAKALQSLGIQITPESASEIFKDTDDR